MALYLGSEKVNINMGGITYCLNLFTDTSIIDSIRLFSLDNYILKDSNGLYLTTKDGDE